MVFKRVFILIISIIALFLLLLYPFLYSYLFNLPKKEILIIGLDGGDYSIIRSLLDKNELPNLRDIVDRGTFISFHVGGNLDSYSAWNSLATCNETSLWDKLKEKNVTFGTLYWPDVPEKGLFMVPDEFEGKKEWPDDVYDSKALLIFKNPVTEFFRKVYWVTNIMFPQNKIEKDLVYEFYLLDRNAREFFYVREKFRPQLSFLVFSSPLRIEQYFWMYGYPEKFGNYVTEKEKEQYGKAIEDYYIEMDDFLGKLDMPSKTLMIISNRGVRELYPPSIVDKIDVDKILKEIGVLRFDYRGEIDFSKTEAYTLEEGLDKELKIFITGKNFDDIKKELKRAFDDAISLPSGQKIFLIEDVEKGLIIKRNISLVIEDDRFSISNKSYSFNDFVLKRSISATHESNGFILINKKVKLPEEMASNDFCKVLLNLVS